MTIEQTTGFARVAVGSLKMTREALCLSQSALRDRARSGLDVDRVPYAAERLQALIDQIDVHRPLGSDGKHGNRHTATCGCEDKS